MIRLWGRSTSTNVQKVLWLCRELNLAFDHREVGGPFGGLDTPEFFSLNPNRTVPVFDHDGAVIWESHAILRFIANKYRAHDYYPDNPEARSFDDQWLDWHSNIFWPPVRTLFLDGRRDRLFEMHSQRALKLLEQITKNIGLLETCRLEGMQSHDGAPRLSDVPLVIGVNRLLTTKPDFPLPPRVAQWFDRMTARPAFDTIRQAEEKLRN